MSDSREQLLTLANLWCEEQLSSDGLDQLQSLLRSDKDLQSLFVEFIQLHGQLVWDAGVISGSGVESLDEFSSAISDRDLPVTVPLTREHRNPKPSRSWKAAAVAVACLMAAVAAGVVFHDPGAAPQVAGGNGLVPSVPVDALNSQDRPSEDLAANSGEPMVPLKLDALANSKQDDLVKNDESLTPLPQDPTPGSRQPALDDDAVVATIDRLIQVGWKENKVTPAAVSEDHEWVRRTYLTLTGRIPSIAEVASFAESASPRKRLELVDRLLASPQTAENLAVIWTNLLIGRSNARGVDQQSLFAFLQEQFSGNRPWMDTVGQLIAAEGRSDKNGATNFLLAHLNDQATPATAVTARLFLGQQVHCTQCHDHPFSKERQQQEFWSLNAFFKQAERKQITVAGAAGKDSRIWTLADSGNPGMTFYDTLHGQKKAVPPEFAGESLAADATKSRRAELARLLAADDKHQVARAMVNRMWAQFFGYGFTTPIDDIGPHSPASHPELFDQLTQAFVESNYDLRRLMRWFTLSEAFGLSSVQTVEAFVVDDPQEGGTPLFSRAYPRQMGPEQVYESIRIAIRSVSDQPIDSSIGTTHRQHWVEQFVQSYGTDENDEQLAFDGNIAQALLMMNGQDLQDAIPMAAVEVTKSVRDQSHSADTLPRLALATLNRAPTDNEEKVFRNRYRSLARSLPADEAMKTATEDMLWAYLNSSEFVSVH